MEVGTFDTSTDFFGDDVIRGDVHWQQVNVFGWALNVVDEQQGDSVSRTRDHIDLYAPHAVSPLSGQVVRLPDGTVWEVEGNPQNYDNNPWWQPGLAVTRLYRVEG
ncbi:hypothetical protein [Corynebacterium aquilae]|uniref:hypothetical protein n=1 Tax=Corynebacterium aquilae TaxID=203263 RepID=UPI0012ED8519|nr:hypothetical protein [Corynebacterium aquilae]